MNIFKAGVFLLILYFPSLQVMGNEHGIIELKNAKGAAPLTVKVSGPEALIKNRLGKPSPFVGCGFSIDWGDGSPLPENCEDWLQHTYTTAGHYEVTAALWHPGPTDIPITTWEGQANVEVAGDEKLSSLKSIHLSGTDFGFYEAPEILLGISAGKKIDIRLDMINSKNEIVNSDFDKNISFVGNKKYRLSLGQQDSLYKSELLKGNTKFRVRAIMLDGGREVSKLVSGEFISTAELRSEAYSKNLDLIVKSNAASFEVVAKYEVDFPSCFNYEIDWGDNSKDVVETKITQPSCRGGYKTVDLGSHKYLNPGVYFVKLKTNQDDLWTSLNQIPQYVSKRIELK